LDVVNGFEPNEWLDVKVVDLKALPHGGQIRKLGMVCIP
jgi:hypothetical protein